MERYQRLFSLSNDLYYEGSPIVISAGELLKDNKDSRILAHLKIKNIYEAKLTFCKVAIKAYEPSGKELEGVDSFSYLDLSIPFGQTFGTKTAIYLPSEISRRFSVAVIEAVFADGYIWTEKYQDWSPVEKTVPISTVFSDPEMVKQYKIETGVNVFNKPQKIGSYFQCTCGAISRGSICFSCKNTYEKLERIIDDEELIQRKNDRIQKNLEEKYQRLIDKLNNATTEENCLNIREEFETISDYKESNKYIEIATDKINIFKNESIYKEALANMNSKDVMQVKKAAESFELLDGYRDSKDKTDECEQIIDILNILNRKKRTRRKIAIISATIVVISCVTAVSIIFWWLPAFNFKRAVSMAEGGKYDEAIALFEDIDNNSQADEWIQACKYNKAVNLAEGGKHDEAISLFTSIDENTQTIEWIKKCKYDKASKLLEEKNYDGALELFGELVDYSDSADKYQEIQDEISYKEALRLIENEKYYDAIKVLETVPDYKDSLNLLNDLKGKMLKIADIGESVYFGNNGVEWYVIDKKDDMIFVVRKDIYSYDAYSTREKNNYWDNSTLREYLNGYYIESEFSKEEAQRIVSIDNQTKHGKKIVYSKDKVFLLAMKDLRLLTKEQRNAGECWWLRNGDYEESYYDYYKEYILDIYYVDSFGTTGDHNEHDVRDYVGVRPAMWINISE